MNKLKARILTLTDSELVEAATFFLPGEVGHADLAAVEARLRQDVQAMGGAADALQDLIARVKADRASYRYLLRDALTRAADGTPAQQHRLEEALDGVNQSQVVTEVMFAVLAASLVKLAWLANPPTETITHSVATQKGDGTTVTETTTSVKEIPPPAGDLLRWIQHLPGISKATGGQ